MKTIEFSKREITGKSVKSLVKEGIIPGVVYNAKGESFNVQLSASMVEEILKTISSTTIVDAKLDGKNIKVVLKDIDRNPLSDIVRHFSFFMIDETESMIFTIPFNIIGVSPAVKNNLGILVKALDSIDVRCKSADVVPSIDIDIPALEHPGQSITVSDIKLPNGMSLPNDDYLHTAIVTITQIQKQEEKVVAEGEVAAEDAAATTTEETKE